MKDFLGWPSYALRCYAACLCLSNSSFEDAFVMNHELEIVMGKRFNLRDGSKRSENALGYKDLDD